MHSFETEIDAQACNVSDILQLAEIAKAGWDCYFPWSGLGTGLFDAGNSGPQKRLNLSNFLQIKLVWDLGILQQEFLCLCLPR